jgi:hypothetical protein
MLAFPFLMLASSPIKKPGSFAQIENFKPRNEKAKLG